VSRVRENRMPGSTGGGWKRNATASPRQPSTQPTSRQEPASVMPVAPPSLSGRRNGPGSTRTYGCGESADLLYSRLRERGSVSDKDEVGLVRFLY
jgi:hypothetical protein